jgi:hypothetical protein
MFYSVFGKIHLRYSQAVPEGLTTNPSQLAGLALVDTASTPHTIRYCKQLGLDT